MADYHTIHSGLDNTTSQFMDLGNPFLVQHYHDTEPGKPE